MVQKLKTQKKTKNNPTEEVIKWVKEFVEVPHPVFADMPPCPYAKQARLDGKVEFKEVTDMEPDSNLWVYIDRFCCVNFSIFLYRQVVIIKDHSELLSIFISDGLNS